MLVSFVLTASIQAKTVPQRFLVHEGSAYVASPTYPVKSVTVYERLRWSADGSRLAIISDSSTDAPASQARKLARGEQPSGPQRLCVWSRETGRLRGILTTAEARFSIDKIAFVGHDLVFSSSSGEEKGYRLWIVRDGGNAMPLNLPESTGSLLQFVPSRRQVALLIAESDRMWMMTTTQTRSLPLPAETTVYARDVDIHDRPIVIVIPKSGQPYYLSADFSTGIARRAEEALKPHQGESACPFILDLYALNGKKAGAREVDAFPGYVSDEDGGYRLDLVESKGSLRRRLPFLNETGRLPEIADDGLSFAFVSNGVLMVKYLVRCDASTTKRLMGEGSKPSSR